LEKINPGLYFILSKTKETEIFSFIIYQSKNLEHRISLKKLSEMLKNKFGIRGGGSDDMIQGGGENINIKNLEAEIISWLKLNNKD